MRMKLKMQWRPQEVKDARNMENMPIKAAGSEQSQPKREAMWVGFSH
jgi:hypothetical protein